MPAETPDKPVDPRLNKPLGQAVLICGLLGGALAFAAAMNAGRPVLAVILGLAVTLGVAIVVAIYTSAALAPPPPPAASLSGLEVKVSDILLDLEAVRLEVGRRNRLRGWWSVPVGALLGLGAAWVLAPFDDLAEWFESPFSWFGMLVGGTLLYTLAIQPITGAYASLYKRRILPKLAAGFGALTYRRPPRPDVAMLKRCRLFPDFAVARADDAIVGTYRGLAVSVTQLWLGPRLPTGRAPAFAGLFVEVTLANRLTGVTAIAPQAQGWLERLRGLAGAGDMRRVGLEDPQFEARYEVASTDQVMARALVTPDFMARFLALGERATFDPPVALARDQTLLVALPRAGRESFFKPPPYDQSAFDAEALQSLRDDVGAVLHMIDPVVELDAATRRHAEPPPQD